MMGKEVEFFSGVDGSDNSCCIGAIHQLRIRTEPASQSAIFDGRY